MDLIVLVCSKRLLILLACNGCIVLAFWKERVNTCLMFTRKGWLVYVRRREGYLGTNGMDVLECIMLLGSLEEFRHCLEKK
jgi:hypothetical protein